MKNFQNIERLDISLTLIFSTRIAEREMSGILKELHG